MQAALAGTRLTYILRGLWKFMMPRAELLRQAMKHAACSVWSCIIPAVGTVLLAS